MALYYASIGYTSTPRERQEIPVGGIHPLHFPVTEQNDMWGMHPDRRTDGEAPYDYLADDGTALIIPPVDGHATIQLDVTWADGTYTRRHHILGDNQPYEGSHPDAAADVTWTYQALVTQGEPLAIAVGHDSNTPKEILAARVQIAIHGQLAEPDQRPIRIRVGTTPDDNTQPRE